MRWIDAARSRLRLLLARRAAESRMDKEFRFHIEMETERLVNEHGLDEREARRRALAAFGGVEKHKEALRDGRGFSLLGGVPLDLKLGVRMLAKYPGISIVGGLAMVIGIGLGAACLEVTNDFLHPSLPLDEGERIVGLRNWDAAANDPEPRAVHDFVMWRQELRSVQNLSAFRTIQRNLQGADGAAQPAEGAAITASAFQVVRVPALLGRTLLASDETSGAPGVIVLGYQLWRNRFAGDPAVVGRAILVGKSQVTIAGVMPEGFSFPVNHQFWVPLSAESLVHERRQGPPIQIFGRLAPGITRKQAQVELAAIGLRTAAESPATHQHLRPRVLQYTALFVGEESVSEAYLPQFFFVMLLLVLSSNVATMVFARTATREHEIAMRFALGSSRGRILAQFFIEALVLALAATAVGLTLVSSGAAWVTRLLWDVTDGRLPFWLQSGVTLNRTTIAYAVGLALVGSMVAGLVPALKATRSQMQTSLRHAPGMGDSALRFGGLWGAMIVIQVAFAVVVLPPAIVAISSLADADHSDPGFAAEEYLSARLELDGPLPEFQGALEELRRLLLMHPGVSRVTLANRLPGMNHPEPSVEVAAAEGAAAVNEEVVMAASVEAEYFNAFGAVLVAGRGFTSADLRPDSRVVVVNEDFANEILAGRNAVGRRVRYQTRHGERMAAGQPQQLPGTAMLEPGPWFEIIGVVKNLGMDTTRDAFTSGRGPGVYHPISPPAMGGDGSYSVRMAFHVRGDAASLAPVVRQLAQAAHPALRVYDLLPLDHPIDRVSQNQRRVARFFSWATTLVAFIALLISIAGIYSVLSFTVARHTREIGIRIALGADHRRVIGRVFSRAMLQIGAGIGLGAAIWFYVIVYQLGGGNRAQLLVATAVGVMAVGLVACAVPVRRALRIEPTEALRHEG